MDGRRAAVTRRTVLRAAGGVAVAAAGTAVLVACGPGTPNPSASPLETPSIRPTLTPAAWSELASAISGTLDLPSDAGYSTAKLTENPRFDDATPLAVLEVASAQDVAAALAFAKKYGVPIALRSGGHNYAGWSAGGAPGSAVPASLIISTARLTDVKLGADDGSVTPVTVGAGASLAELYATVGAAGRAVAGGSCATVGATGLTLGGGVGVLVRSFGLACDQLTGVEIVTADGTVHQASSTTDTDLFWASQGGGGGMLGVVTSLTFATKEAPTVNTWYVDWPWSSAAQVVASWQNWAPGADNRLWSTLKLLGGPGKHPDGPDVSVSGTCTGDFDDLQTMLAPLLGGVDAPPNTNRSFTHTYADAMAIEAGCENIAVAECNTGADGALKRESSSGTSSIGYTTLDASGIADVIAQVEGAQNLTGMREGGISMDALGGVVATVDPSATAFVHRKALMTVQYTGTFDDGSDPAPFDAFVRGFRQTMTAHWHNWAYVNYCDQTIPDATTAYFGANLSRLAALKKQYDPDGMFTQPQSY